MFEKLNFNGYDLHQLPNHPDLWSIDTKTTEPYSGSMKEVVVYMLDRLGFKMEYIEEGINILADNVHNGHDSVHFGAYKSAIFSFKKEENHGKRAS